MSGSSIDDSARIPDIRKDAEAWFKYFDGNARGHLEKAEVLQALLDTLNATTGNIPDIEQLMETMDNLWTLFELDAAGIITFEQFKADGGLCESIVSSMPAITPVPSSAGAASGAINRSIAPVPPQCDSTRVQCGRCGTQMMAVPPRGAVSFNVTCTTCRVSNRFDVPVPQHLFFQPSEFSSPIMAYTAPEATNVSGTVRLPVRRALLIGINYIGNRAQLKGSVNDAYDMRRLLMETFGWSGECIRLLSDDQRDPEYRPTRANIILSMRWLAEDVRRGYKYISHRSAHVSILSERIHHTGDVLVFHFSGHGSQKVDPNGYEEDGMNECILPMDFRYADVITDDLMNSIMVRNLPSCVKLTVVMDCCHSGTGLDLPFEWTASRMAWREETNPYHTRGDVQLLSGCSDRGSASDSHLYYNSPGGALTQSLCLYLRENPCPSYPELLDGLTNQIRAMGFKQRPVLSSSQAFDVNRPFLLEDIVPNTNGEDVVGKRIVRVRFRARPRRSYRSDSRLTPETTALGVGAAVGTGVLFGCLLGGALS